MNTNVNDTVAKDFEIIELRRSSDGGCGMSALLPVIVNGQNMKMLVDTGAAVTILSSKLINKLPVNMKPNITPCDTIKLQSANGNLISVDGTAEVILQLGKSHFPWKVFVANITDDGLLGYDFLYNYDCAFEARRGVRIKGQWFKCDVQNAPALINKVCVSKDVNIPAMCEFVIEASADLSQFSTRDGLVEPKSQTSVNNVCVNIGDDDLSHLIVGATLVDTMRRDIGIPVRLMNPTNSDIRLHAGTVIGHISEVDGVEIVADEERDTEGALRNCVMCYISNM